MEDNKNIGFNLRGIKTEQFALFEEHLNIKEDAQVHSALQFRVNPTMQQLGVFMHFEFKQSGHIILKLVLSCHFGIDPLSWNSFTEKNSVRFPKEFVRHLSMISVGTARGVLAAKTENTFFSKFILPLLDLTKMITADIVFELE